MLCALSWWIHCMVLERSFATTTNLTRVQINGKTRVRKIPFQPLLNVYITNLIRSCKAKVVYIIIHWQKLTERADLQSTTKAFSYFNKKNPYVVDLHSSISRLLQRCTCFAVCWWRRNWISRFERLERTKAEHSIRWKASQQFHYIRGSWSQYQCFGFEAVKLVNHIVCCCNVNAREYN